MIIGFAAAVAAVIAALLVRQFCNPGSRLHILDHPNERSLHTRPTPRTGGVAILGGLVAGLAVYGLAVGFPSGVGWMVAGAAVIALLSFVDDRRGLGVRVRLLGHFTGAGLVVIGGFALPDMNLPGLILPWPEWAGSAVALVFLVWMVNLYNFMDGMDGFAGGMGVAGFGTMALLGALAGDSAFLAVNAVIASAVAGFLVFNFPPARIFMGDTGSAALGLLAGGMSLWGARDGVFPFWVAVLVFAPFIVDATVTLLRRLLRGERIWQAHRSHYYQRLVQSGWSHRKTVLHEYLLMLACGASGVLALGLSPARQWLLIGFWCAVYATLMVFVSRLERSASA